MHLDSLLVENLEYNDLVRKFEGNMKEALNIIAPEITKTITVRHQNPWFTEELRTPKENCREKGNNLQEIWSTSPMVST